MIGRTLMKKSAMLLAGAMLLGSTIPVHAGDHRDDAALGGVLGGVLGAVVGNGMGGQNGAVVGAVIGAATGAYIATEDDKKRRRASSAYYGYDNRGYRNDRYRYDGRYDRYARSPQYRYYEPPRRNSNNWISASRVYRDYRDHDHRRHDHDRRWDQGRRDGRDDRWNRRERWDDRSRYHHER